jgi:hypothetical protein
LFVCWFLCLCVALFVETRKKHFSFSVFNFKSFFVLTFLVRRVNVNLKRFLKGKKKRRILK